MQHGIMSFHDFLRFCVYLTLSVTCKSGYNSTEQSLKLISGESAPPRRLTLFRSPSRLFSRLVKSNGVISQQHHYPRGITPDADRVLRFEGFTSGISESLMMPLWVSEALDHRESRVAISTKTIRDFEGGPPGYNKPVPTDDDYRGTEFNRGHMAAAMNHRGSRTALKQTMYLVANIVPQHRDLNTGLWADLELLVYRWSRSHPLYVLTGPLWLANHGGALKPCCERCRKMQKYQFRILGDSGLMVPSHLYKVVRIETGDRPTWGAFIIPNKSICRTALLDPFLEPIVKGWRNIDVISRVAGINLTAMEHGAREKLVDYIPPKRTRLTQYQRTP